MLVTLEIVDGDKAVVDRLEMHLFDETHVWKRVVEAARALQRPQGLRIRALDDAGGILVLTGALAAALVDRV